MIRRLPYLAIWVSFVASNAGAQQAVTPQLTKPQREVLRSIVTAVDQASDAPETPGVTWPVHIMRASDGSHYVAFSLTQSSAPLPAGPFMLYVRLATAPPSSAQTVSERSTVEEWLTGKRKDPLQQARSGIVPGEMPNFGAGGIAARGSTPTTGSNDLSLMAMERSRARQEKEDRERQRKAELEGLEHAKGNLLPFEDFEANTPWSTDAPAIERALTAGPGDYFLYVGWADATAKSAIVHVAKRLLHLPPAAPTLMISSIIVADRVDARDTPYSTEQQRSHPYAIGVTDITPARDNVFTRDERIAVAFQVINPRASEAGKPDIAINFRIVRVSQDREQLVATLTPQTYDAASMPADFDLRMGHPLFAAVAAPLATVPRGDYRLKILVNDHISGLSTTADADFAVVSTPRTLLAEAPPLGRAFRREDALEPALLRMAIEKLRPASPSPALSRALDVAQKAQFVELLREEPVGPAEQGVRTALSAIALYSAGDPASASVQLQRALQLNAPAGPVQFFLGSARALQGRDVDAIAAWQAALDGGMPSQSLTSFLVNAHLRRGDAAKAASLLTADPAGDKSGEWVRTRAAVQIASGQALEAIPLLQARLASQADDRDAEWLLLHALFASIVHAPSGAASPNLALFASTARNYLAGNGIHSDVAAEWLKVLEK